MGMSYSCMSKIFGQCSTSISDWCLLIRKVIKKSLFVFQNLLRDHPDFGLQWQQEQAKMFKLRHLANWHNFKGRMTYQNEYGRRRRDPYTQFDIERYQGTVGAVDGTHNICPRSNTVTLNEEGDYCPDDRLYCKYLGKHGYK
jgi:hypothetical protein